MLHHSTVPKAQAVRREAKGCKPAALHKEVDFKRPEIVVCLCAKGHNISRGKVLRDSLVVVEDRGCLVGDETYQYTERDEIFIMPGFGLKMVSRNEHNNKHRL